MTTRPDGPSSEQEVDPVEFLKRMLQISPEDAAEVREEAARAAGTAPPNKPKPTDPE